MAKLDASTIQKKLPLIDGWKLKDEKLYKKLQFSNFVKAFAVMTSIAIEAEKMNHHPEWFNVYNTLEIYLTTHDAGGISELDFKLAHIIDSLAH